MTGIGNYLLSLTGASILCGILKTLIPGKGSGGRLISLLCGVILTLTALKPLTGANLADLSERWISAFSPDTYLSDSGENMARDAMAAIIKEECETYILDKATSLGLDITVGIALSDGDIPAPVSVVISGDASPYARSRLQQIIASDLGIPKEAHRWI